MAKVEPYVDSSGATEPSERLLGSTAHYIGNVRRGALVAWDATGRWHKVMRHSPGSTTVRVRGEPRVFTPAKGPKAGEVVQLPGKTDHLPVSRGTVVVKKSEVGQ